MDQRHLSRRTALVSAVGVGVGVPVLNACGGGATSGAGDGGYGAPPAGGNESPSATEQSPAGGSEARGEELVGLADVPVGGAVVVEDAAGEPLVVAQPTQGEVVAFSAVCTHRGCTVAADGDVLRCPCHGSTFDPATGENTGGPAPRPLPEVAVRVDGDSVVAG